MMAHIDSRIKLCKQGIMESKVRRSRIEGALEVFPKGVPGYRELMSVIEQIDDDLEVSSNHLLSMSEIKKRYCKN